MGLFRKIAKKISLNNVKDIVQKVGSVVTKKKEEPKSNAVVTPTQTPKESFLAKKEGGSVAGNLVRGVLYNVTDGLAGTGKNRPDITTQSNNNDIIASAIGVSANQIGQIAGGYLNNGIVAPKVTKAIDQFKQSQTGKGIISTLTEKVLGIGKETLVFKSKEWLRTNWYFLLIPFGLLIYFLFFRKKQNRNRARRR